MSETDTQCQVSSVLRTVEEWAARKETKRWLLCLAATGAGWLPEQEDDAQDEVTEEAYDAAVEAADVAYKRCEQEQSPVHGQTAKGTVRAICHPTHYVGVIVKRLPPTEVKAFQRQVDKLSRSKDEELGKMLGEHFRAIILWPEPRFVESVRQRMNNAIESVLPMKWLLSLGADGGDRVKKR